MIATPKDAPTWGDMCAELQKIYEKSKTFNRLVTTDAKIAPPAIQKMSRPRDLPRVRRETGSITIVPLVARGTVVCHRSHAKRTRARRRFSVPEPP